MVELLTPTFGSRRRPSPTDPRSDAAIEIALHIAGRGSGETWTERLADGRHTTGPPTPGAQDTRANGWGRGCWRRCLFEGPGLVRGIATGAAILVFSAATKRSAPPPNRNASGARREERVVKSGRFVRGLEATDMGDSAIELAAPPSLALVG